MHGNEMNPRIILDESLGSIAMVNIPVHDQDAFGIMNGSRIVGCKCDVSEETESHGPVKERVMTRGANRDEASLVCAAEGQVHGVKSAACACGTRIPGSFARDGIRVDLAAPGSSDGSYALDVFGVMHPRDFFCGRVPSLDLSNALKKLRVVPQRSRDGAQASYMFGMAPPRIVPAAVRMGNERGLHLPWLQD
jgi:hypothetical protein